MCLVANSSGRCCMNTDRHLDGAWEEFDAWIRETIGSDVRWRVRPQDARENREMIVGLILDKIKRNNSVCPEANTFIERA